MSTNNATTAPGLSEIERVVDTFVAPSKTFEDIRIKASWWLPFLLILIFSAASAFVVDKEVGYDRVYQNTIHSMPFLEDQLSKLPPDQKAAADKSGIMRSRIGAYTASVILLIVYALYALILWASFNFGLGAQTSYNQVFAVVWYAALPLILRFLLTMLTVHFGGNAEAFDARNPVGTNPAYYLPDAAGWLKGLLSAFDIAALWSVALTIVGMAIVARKSLAQSALVVGIFWVLGVVYLTVVGAFTG